MSGCESLEFMERGWFPRAVSPDRFVGRATRAPGKTKYGCKNKDQIETDNVTRVKQYKDMTVKE